MSYKVVGVSHISVYVTLHPFICLPDWKLFCTLQSDCVNSPHCHHLKEKQQLVSEMQPYIFCLNAQIIQKQNHNYKKYLW